MQHLRLCTSVHQRFCLFVWLPALFQAAESPCRQGAQPDAVQVDVRALKETLWHGMGSVQEASSEQVVSFQDLIADVPSFGAAGRAEDLSVHLCFICLLHLANEHGLAISGTESLDQLVVSHPAL